MSVHALTHVYTLVFATCPLSCVRVCVCVCARARVCVCVWVWVCPHAHVNTPFHTSFDDIRVDMAMHVSIHMSLHIFTHMLIHSDTRHNTYLAFARRNGRHYALHWEGTHMQCPHLHTHSCMCVCARARTNACARRISLTHAPSDLSLGVRTTCISTQQALLWLRGESDGAFQKICTKYRA